MECYGEKMLPNGLPELIYQVTPEKIREQLKVIVYPKKRNHTYTEVVVMIAQFTK